MYIKPIDYVNLISKTQEIVRIKQVEADKAVFHFDNRIIQKDKEIKENMKKVNNTQRGESIAINKNKEGKGNKQYYHTKKKRSRKKGKNNPIENKELRGCTIDIKV